MNTNTHLKTTAAQAVPVRLRMLCLQVFVLLCFASGASLGAAEPRKVVVDGTEVDELGFGELSSYPITIIDIGTGATPAQIAEAKTKDPVPTWLRAFDGRRVVLTGFLLPIQFDNGLATKLMLMRDVNTCCYGRTPAINDFVVVEMKGRGIEAVQDVPTKLLGTLHIGQKYEGDYLISVYDLEGERLVSDTK